MAFLLDACRSWPPSPEVLIQLQGMTEWEQAQKWGWIMRNVTRVSLGSDSAITYIREKRLRPGYGPEAHG
jgi:hypothetical protein